MSPLRAEAHLLLRSGRNLFALLLLLALSSAAVWAGISKVNDQRATIERVEREQVRDLAAVEQANAGPEGDAGYNAYYAFMLTQDSPPHSLLRRSASVTCNPMSCAFVRWGFRVNSTTPRRSTRSWPCPACSIGRSC